MKRAQVDAGFIWTEPHSKELKLRLKLQKEARRALLWDEERRGP